MNGTAARPRPTLPSGPILPLDRPSHSDRSSELSPSRLPPSGSPERWPWLQRLRRLTSLDPHPWLQALEAGGVDPDADLLAVLVERLDGQGSARLLQWWLTTRGPGTPGRDQAWRDQLALVGRHRDHRCAAALRQGLERDLQPALLPLLGHQRDPADFPLLRQLALEAGPMALRRQALEGLAVGLSAWPLPELRRTLRDLALDLDPLLAGQAVDLLARVPTARPELLVLARRRLDPIVAERLRRRLRALPVSALLLVVHGRAGGEIPAELQNLALELARRRGAPVRLQALTADAPPRPEPLRTSPAGGATEAPLTLVPLFLLPGAHVRLDLPAIAAHWRRSGPVRRLPFLGGWPLWQRSLAEEAAAVAAAEPDGNGPDARPLLLHHPLDGALAPRYLAHLEHTVQARCLATPYSAADFEELKLAIRGAALPLALAANRLTDSLSDQVGPPLLQRERFRTLLLEQLEALP